MFPPPARTRADRFLLLVLVLGLAGIDRGRLQSVHPGRHSTHTRQCFVEFRDVTAIRDLTPDYLEEPSVLPRSRTRPRQRCAELHSRFDPDFAVCVRGRTSGRMGGEVFLGPSHEEDQAGADCVGSAF